ncbi:uncharacterized protein PV07_09234 [Cladophialophora immunda]|uniref:Xylanolytic transcriptional activator regulatory domain-containing protein n=1 Tax=Cladophialophora immunda TaxID=569365 RepID=A0A0D2AM03_9EURO|nr:uncharacterized protein PV07_09234 [Cladophialophora immunda]KIW26107.1 hypothetical protein PV07_09234 [Cladophialophora immunda]
MDEMLEQRGVHVSSSSLSLFSDNDIRTISHKLSNTRFGDLIESFSDSINKRLGRKANESYPKVTFKVQAEPLQLSLEQRTQYVRAYFDHIHPIFPFLVEEDFAQQVLNNRHQEFLEQGSPFLVLYHAVLAIGSQYTGYGAFEPGKGPSWQIFQVALNHLQELIGFKPCLESVQFCYSMTHCGGQIAETLLSEAARMAQFVRLNRGSAALTDGAHQRTFWVIYSLEKLSSFCQGRTSAIPDEDIGCHIPHVPESIFGEFNWFLSSVRFGRLISRAQSSLFSVSATMKSKDEYQRDLQAINVQLEAWRQSIPPSFRPGDRFARANLASPTFVMAALRTHLIYHNFVMVLCRLNSQVNACSAFGFEANDRETFMSSARRVIELTTHIEVEPYAPSVLLTVFPLSAFFSLFHLVIDNPHHAETRDNLTFLDVAAGYFRRLEYIMKQEFPFSIFPKLAAVAHEYVLKLPGPSDITAPAGQVGASPLPENHLPSEPGMSVATPSGLGLSGGQVPAIQQQNDFGDQLYGMGGSNRLEPLPFARDGNVSQADGTQFNAVSGAMDFFGNLLDETYSSLYGVDISWQ